MAVRWNELVLSTCVCSLHPYVYLVHRRANAQQPKLFVGMILILIFAEALALYGLIGAELYGKKSSCLLAQECVPCILPGSLTGGRHAFLQTKLVWFGMRKLAICCL